MKRQNSVALFIEIIIVLGLIVYTIITDAVVSNRLDSGLKSYFTSEVKEQTAAFQDEFDAELSKTKSFALSSKSSYEFAIRNGAETSDAAESICANLVNELRADSAAVISRSGSVIASRQYTAGSETAVLQAALRGESGADFVKENGAVYAVAAAPLANEGIITGAVLVKKNISVQSIVDKVKAATCSEATVFDNYTRHVTTIEGMQGTKLANPEIIDRVKKEGHAISIINKIGTQDSISCYFPLFSKTGEFVTTLYLGRPLTVVGVVSKTIFTPLLFVSIIAMVIVLILFIILIKRSISRPLALINAAVTNLSSGDADLTYRLPENGNNEFTQVTRGVNKFIGLLESTIIRVQEIADEVLRGSSQISSSSQAISAGASEQAASTEEMSATMEEIASNISQTADNAEQTRSIAVTTCAEGKDGSEALFLRQLKLSR